MPSYISHAIMGEQLYKECNKEGNIFQIPINIDEFKGYSLGIDLAYFSKRITSDPHNCHTREFFLNMIQYIKDNKLIENSHIMALLYGHIAHYFLDVTCHPFIYYLEGSCQKIGLISPHDLIEGYLSFYLSEKILNKNIMDIKATYFNKIDLSKPEIANLLNSLFGKLYNDYHITKNYKYILSLFTVLEKFIKSGIVSKEDLVKTSSFNAFLEKNNLTTLEITNEMNNIFRNPVTGEVHSESFLELYLKSIDMSLEAIYETNKYLYSNTSIINLEQVFTDASYDTGVSCSLGRNFIYTRKRSIQQKTNIKK